MIYKRSKISHRAKHFMTDTRLCKIYYGIRKRCLNPKSIGYKYYGGKGIKICEEWLDKKNGSIRFIEWANKNGYKEDLTIDRIDPNGDYCPENCRWITSKAQNNNRTSNILYSYKGETHNINEWCEILGLNYSTVYTRLFREKIPFEEAIKKENRDNKNRKKVYCVESGIVYESVKNAAESIKGNIGNLIRHIKNGKEYKGLHWGYL